LKSSFTTGFHAQLIALSHFAKSFQRPLKPAIGRFPSLSAPTAVVLLFAMAVVVAGVSLLQFAGSSPDSTVTASTAHNEERSVQPPAAARSAAAPEPVADTSTAQRSPGKGGLQDGQTDGPPATHEASTNANPPDFPSRQRPLSDVLARSPAPSEFDADGAVVAVAETAEEILALEEIQRREVEADLARPSMEMTAAIQAGASTKVAAKATRWVNLRSGPSDDAEVLLVVPGLASIKAESGCNWCAVTYDGREGYIYKNFISYE
jgi:hypothetical protein